MTSLINSVLRYDPTNAIRTAYGRFRPYRAIILGSFGLCIFTYLIFITQMMPDNHATRFPWLLPGGIGSGRWLSSWIGHLHYGADVPVFLPVLGIALGILAAVMILDRWRLSLGAFSAWLIVSIIVTYPANLAHFYYSFMSPLFFGSIFFAAIAFFVCGRFRFLDMAGAAAAVVLMLATYQLAASILITVSVLAAIADIIRQPDRGGIRSAIETAAARAIATVVGGIAYRITLAMLGSAPPRSITYTSWQEVPARTLQIVRASFEHLVVTQPELLLPVKMVLFALLVTAVAVSIFRVRRSPLAILLVVFLWPVAVVATKAIFLVVEPDGSLWEYRYNTSLGFLHAFSIGLLLSSLTAPLAYRAAQAVGLFVLVSFVQADLLRQGVLLRGMQHDLALANRILDRIETLPDVDYSQTYDLIRVGRYSSYRFNLLRSRGHEFYRLGDTHMDIGEISDRWVDEDVFRMLGSAVQFQFESTDPQFSEKIQRVQNGLLEGRRPWPAPESVFLNGNEIIVYMREE